MIAVKNLQVGMKVWEAYENGEEQEFVVVKTWYDSLKGKFYAELDYVDDDYFMIISDSDEKDFYFK